MTDPVPTQKSDNQGAIVMGAAATLAGALTTIVVYTVHTIWHLALPPEIEQSIQVLVTALVVGFTHKLSSGAQQ